MADAFVATPRACRSSTARELSNRPDRDAILPDLPKLRSSGESVAAMRKQRMQQRGGILERVLIALLIGAVALVGCASTRGTAGSGPTDEEIAAAEAAGFEMNPPRRASELLPADLLSGPYHRVDEHVVTGEFTNYYVISSDFGDFEARGDQMLRVRIREIEALATLSEMSETAEFARAASNALKSPFVATWNLITNPVDTIRGIPVGAWNAIEHTSQLMRRERGELEDSGLLAVIGFESKKRQIANELDIDPYSSNRELQKQLNRFAWAAYAGGLPYLFVPFVDDRDFQSDLSGPQNRLTELLLFYSPEDLRRLNRIELAVMGVAKPLSDEFIRHPWYSPRHETVIVEALSALDLTADRAEFLRVAITARSEEEAGFYQRTAELMRVYSDRVSAFQRIVVINGVPMGYTQDGALVLPLPADHTIWNPTIAALTHAMTHSARAELNIERTELLVSGTVSSMARQKIEALGITVNERAFERPTQSADAVDRSETE